MLHCSVFSDYFGVWNYYISLGILAITQHCEFSYIPDRRHSGALLLTRGAEGQNDKKEKRF